jgi:hypothetical protein
MLRMIDQTKDKSRSKNVSPLFMPWSDKLNESAYRKGGSGLEDLLPFFSSLDIGGEGIFRGSSSAATRSPSDEEDSFAEQNLGSKALVQSKSSGPSPLPTFQKATWEEFDEPVNIDAVIRQWDSNKG